MNLTKSPSAALSEVRTLPVPQPAAVQMAAQIAAAEAFHQTADGADRVVVLTLPRQTQDWAQARDAGELHAFLRWAALHWAQAGTRVNALGFGQGGAAAPAMPATQDDVAASLALFTAASSMTGQVIRLG